MIIKLQKLPQDVRIITTEYPDSESSVSYPEDVQDVSYYKNGVFGTDGEPVVEISHY